ncbi:MAG: diguanylate cyclase [Microcystaceae cyanobacterium]
MLLSSWAEHLPWSKKLFRGVEEALKEQTNGKGNLFVEHLDYSRLGRPHSDEVMAKFLHQKYSQLHLDGVIVDAIEAVEFILEKGDKIFGDIPYVFYAGKPINSITFSAYAIINLAPVIDKTVLLALQQNPDVERILLVGDSSPQLEDMLKAAYQAIRVHKPDVEVMVKTDFTIDEIEREVSLLPERSLVLFTVVFRDRSGQSLRPIDVLERLVNSASVPIYVFYDPLIGNGAVGGYVQKAAETGEVAIQAIFDLISQRRLGDSIRLEYKAAGMVLDWRSLKRWNIPQSLVPAEAEIRYRKPFVWEVYLQETILALTVIIIGTILIVVITILFMQRRKLSQHLLMLNQQLEQRVADRTQMLHQMATCDDLTGIDNRKEFYRQANAEFQRFKRYKHPFTLAILDIDKFKAINDTYGHLAGDKVLQEFAQGIAVLIRENDIWGRIGGEEFALLLPNTVLSDGVILLEKIRQHIQYLEIVLSDDRVISVTVSIGAVESEMFAQKLEYLLHNADQRLYHAKANGRNQVIFQDADIK